jgi:hypothetical protein
MDFLLDAYDGVSTPPGKGVPDVQAVSDILRDSYDEQTELVGLLHGGSRDVAHPGDRVDPGPVQQQHRRAVVRSARRRPDGTAARRER